MATLNLSEGDLRELLTILNNAMAEVNEQLSHESVLPSAQAAAEARRETIRKWIDRLSQLGLAGQGAAPAASTPPRTPEQNAVREWHTRAIVRVLETTTSRSVWPARERTFQQGEEVEMLQWGEAGRPIDRSAWWTSYDIDAAHVIDASKVEVVRVLDEVSPLQEGE